MTDRDPVAPQPAMAALWTSLRDTWHIGRFEVFRAVRTRRMLAMIVALLAITVLSTATFVAIVHEIETQIATTMGIAATKTPGTLMAELRDSEQFMGMLAAVIGDRELLNQLVHLPVLAIWQLGFGMGMLPLAAAAASSECIAIDVGSRTIRYEALRTGRAEIIAGRFLGQVALMALAISVSLVGAWGFGLATMNGHTASELALGMAWVFPRLVVWAVPFIGLGVFASQLTASAAWARAIAILLLGATYAAAGAVGSVDPPWDVIADAAAPLLPQTWAMGLFRPSVAWLPDALACLAIGAGFAGAGAPRFLRRDL